MAQHFNVAGREMAMMSCGECGIEFMMPSAFQRECRELGKRRNWHCPHGHSRVYTEGEADLLRQERDRLRQQIAQKDDEIAAAKLAAEAEKAKATRLRKRIDNGLCPCCNRSFANLARHMKTKHGDKVVPIKAA